MLPDSLKEQLLRVPNLRGFSENFDVEKELPDNKLGYEHWFFNQDVLVTSWEERNASGPVMGLEMADDSNRHTTLFRSRYRKGKRGVAFGYYLACAFDIALEVIAKEKSDSQIVGNPALWTKCLPWIKYGHASPLKEAILTKQISVQATWSPVGYKSRKREETLQIPPTMVQLISPIKTFLFTFFPKVYTSLGLNMPDRFSLPREIEWMKANLAEESLLLRGQAPSAPSAKALLESRDTMRLLESIWMKVRPLLSRSLHIPKTNSPTPEAFPTGLLSLCTIEGRQFVFAEGKDFTIGTAGRRLPSQELTYFRSGLELLHDTFTVLQCYYPIDQTLSSVGIAWKEVLLGNVRGEQLTAQKFMDRFTP